MITYAKSFTPTPGGQIDVLRSKYTNLAMANHKGKNLLVTQGNIANIVGIANHTYGDYEYWRALMWVNGITDPINEVVIGTVLKAPSRSVIDKFLENRNLHRAEMTWLIK